MTELPLREPTFLVLTALAERPQHGYGVIDDVLRISDGRVRLRAGTLYAALDRLRTDGLVEVDREEIVASRLRRYYRLTEAGSRRLAAESERQRHLAEVATKRLRASGFTVSPPAPPAPMVPMVPPAPMRPVFPMVPIGSMRPAGGAA